MTVLLPHSGSSSKVLFLPSDPAGGASAFDYGISALGFLVKSVI